MKKIIKYLYLYIIGIMLNMGGALGQTALEVQSDARPMGMDIIAPVQQAGSDTSSSSFQSNDLPILREFIDNNLSERSALANADAVALDSSKLTLVSDADVRIYFLGEGAGYHNTLGFNASGIGVSEGDPKLIFPDASSYDSYFTEGDSTTGYRDANYPLLPGDFVDLGNVSQGTNLDFFLIANGVNGGTNVWSANEDYNADSTQHVVSFALPSSPYLLIGFEDLYGGGDLDYNDLVFAVDIGSSNVEYLANPEPTFFVQVAVALSVLFVLRKRLKS